MDGRTWRAVIVAGAVAVVMIAVTWWALADPVVRQMIRAGFQ